MRFKNLYYINLAIFCLITFLICGLQTTFWYQITSSFAPPLLWLNLFTYLILYRKPFESLFFIYFLCLVIAAYSATPIGMLLSTMLVVHTTVRFFKNRIFWPGSRFFMLACAASSIVFNLGYLSISYFFESHISSIEFFDRTIQTLITPLFAYPIYYVLDFIDHLTLNDLNIDSNTSLNSSGES